LEWLVCLLLVRVAGSAKSRFNVWLMLLFAFVAQWIWMLAGVARGAFPAQALAAGAMEGMPAAAGKRIAIAAPAAGTVTQGMAALLVVYGAMLAWRMLGALAARVRLARAMRYRSAPSKTGCDGVPGSSRAGRAGRRIGLQPMGVRTLGASRVVLPRDAGMEEAAGDRSAGLRAAGRGRAEGGLLA